MSTTAFILPIRLGNGLLLRRATAADTEALVVFNGDVLRHQDAQVPDELMAGWTRDLMTSRHPEVRPTDFVVVEDQRSARIVSSMVLISQIWTYGGIAIRVGNPELVGTHPEYRGRGLVRAQFNVIHELSRQRAHDILAIDGIPWFYRQFGYEMAVDLRYEFSIDVQRLPPREPEGREAYRLRLARDADAPFIAATAARGAARYLLTCHRDDALWRYELAGRSDTNAYRCELHVVESGAGAPVGFVALVPRLLGTVMTVLAYELHPDVDWHTVTPSVLLHLRARGDEYARRAAPTQCRRIGFWLGTDHPVYALIGELDPRDEGGYAWYLRVADLPAFVQHVAPVLEQRLIQSARAGYTGELLLSFYRDGLRLRFEDGRLTETRPWRPPTHLLGVERNQPTTAPRAGASFPYLTFIQLLFGYRSLDELRYAFPDCIVRTEDATSLLQTLFPQQPSNVWPLL